MTQPSEFKFYFVLPADDKNAECSKEMYESFDVVQEYNGIAQWILPSTCSELAPKSKDVFVFDEFEGPAFAILKKKASCIISSRCLLRSLSSGSILVSNMPIYSKSMTGLIVCLTGFASYEEDRCKLQEKIEYMGGTYHATLRSIVTHVVARNMLSRKAIEAIKANKPVMTTEWVNAVWKKSKNMDLRGDDPEFDVYKAPLFYNLKITTSGIVKTKKETLKQLIIKNGGSFSGTLENKLTDLLLIENPEGDKFNAATSWKVPCVKPSWVHKCVEMQKLIPLQEYILVSDIGHKASTPVKSQVNFTANFSMVSNIESDEKLCTRLEETADITTTPLSTTMRESTELLNKLSETAVTAGQFLDGCNIYLHGFSKPFADKLRKILNNAGATRFDELTRSVTHIICMGSTSAFKNHDAHVLTIQWLLDSACLKKPAPLYNCVEPVERACPPSPLSKQGAFLLSRPETVTTPLQEVEPPVNDGLVDMYNLSQPGAPIRTNTPAPAQCPSQSESLMSNSSSQFTQTNVNLFNGLKFFVSSELSEEESECVKNLIIERKGSVMPRKFAGVLDFAIVPVAGAPLTQITAKEVVNLFYIKECVVENRLVDVLYYHQPISWIRGATPLEGCVISLSKYTGSERDFLEVVIEILGGKNQEILAKKQKENILKTTHLVCVEPAGAKYQGAIRWGLPVVHHKWLLKSAELGKKMTEAPYLISDSSNVFQDVTSGFNISQSSAAQPPEIKPIIDVIEKGTKENSMPLQCNDAVEVNQSSEPESSAAISPKIVERQLFGQNPRTFASPCNKPLQRIINNMTPQGPGSPDLNRTATPTSPYGSCFGNENPSPGTRKRLFKWTHRGANFSQDTSERRSQPTRREGTPVSELLSRQLNLMMRQPEDRPPDDSPDLPPSKRLNMGIPKTQQFVHGIHKMQEIEQDYSKNKTNSQTTSLGENAKVLFVSESQPHTEIGWEDPLDKDSAPINNKPKIFMFSALATNQETAAKLILKSKGKVSQLPHFDSSATHLIAAPGMTRTEKLMGSIAAGLWLLHPSYLDQLAKVNDVYAIREEDYEWGNPHVKMPLNTLTETVRDCVVSAYHWRCDIQLNKKSPPFFGMNVVLKTNASKAEVFKRLISAGGGTVLNMEDLESFSGQVLCICEPTPKPDELQSFIKKGICCVSPLVVSDFIMRKPTAVKNNLIPGCEDIWPV